MPFLIFKWIKGSIQNINSKKVVYHLAAHTAYFKS